MSPVHPIRTVLSDGSEVMVQGLTPLLEAEGIEVVGTALDLTTMLGELGRRQPDVLLVDAELPCSDPGELVSSARLASPETRVLVLSSHTRPELVEAVLAASPDGCISKSESIRQVAAAVRALASGCQHHINWARPRTARRRDDSIELMVRSLSERELMVLRHLASGHSNARIAKECGLSLNTVRGHVQSILVKLGVHSKVEAVWFAVREGVVTLSEVDGNHRRNGTG
jgi:DNA-binding NarL/FixJ family response regulator